MPTMMPDRLMVKLKFNSERGVNTGTGNAVTHTYAINSAYDPDFSGTGHQPRGFDQWSNFYARYKVHGCKYVTKFINNGDFPVNFGVVWAPNSNISLVSARDCYEQTYGWCTLVPPKGSNNRVTYSRYMSVRKIIGDHTLGDEYEAAVTADPVTQVFLKTFTRDSKGALNAVDCEYDDVLTMYVEFFSRQPITAS